METSRFILEPYAGRRTRHTCPECGKPHEFVRYVDRDTGETLASHVGRCNRETACGYHYTPQQHRAATGVSTDARWFARAATVIPQRVQRPQMLTPFDAKVVTRTRRPEHYAGNSFLQGLAQRFGWEPVLALAQRYGIGTTRDGAVIFWQTDEQSRVRSGKVMHYDPATLRRRKTDEDNCPAAPRWAHTLYRQPGFQLHQCLFGQHLITADEAKQVAVVEAEKTALVCAYYLPNWVWLATGGCAASQLRDPQVVALLRERQVWLLPDTGATDKWQTLAGQLRRQGVRAEVYTRLEELGRPANWDMADELLEAVSRAAATLTITD